jgi:hypothetical protein
VQVFQDENEGLGASLFAQQGCDGIEESESQAFCIGGERPRQIGVKLAQLGNYLGEVRCAHAELGCEHARLRFAYEGAQALDPWPICRSAARFPAPTRQHPGVAVGDACDELLSKRRLADPWLATDQEQRTVAPLNVG